MLERKQLACAAQARLDLVEDQEHVIGGAEFAQALEIALGWDHDAGLALDGLHEHSASVGGDGGLHGLQAAVFDDGESWGEGAEAAGAVGIRAETHDGGGATVEIAFGHDDFSLGVFDALFVVAPLAHGLEGGLNGFGAAVHEQGLLKTCQFAKFLQQHRKLVVAEGAAGERQFLHLINHGLGDARMVVPLVHRRIGRQEIHVLLAVHILEKHTLSPRADYV